MLRIPNRQNLLPPHYHTAFSVQKMPTHVQQQLLLSIIPQIIEKIYSESIDIPIFFSIIELALCLLKLNFEVHFTFI